MSTDTCYSPFLPSLMRRTDSDSSIGSALSQSVRTPTDNIFDRNDEDFGGEPGLVMEDLAEAIKVLLLDNRLSKFEFKPTSTMAVGRGILITWKITPLLDMDNTCLQLRMTEEEVKRLTEVLRGDANLIVTEAKSLLARHLPGTVSYNITSTGAHASPQHAATGDSGRFSLHEFSKPAPRFTTSEDSDDESFCYEPRDEEFCYEPRAQRL